MPRTSRSLAFKVKVPPDFAKALRNRPKIKKIFSAFPPSHQRRYVEYITEAVKIETQRQRIAQSLKMIAAKGRT